MAVTISSDVPNDAPSDNPLEFRFSSNQTAQPNFSFIVRTYLNAVQVAEDQVFVEVSTYGHYDCSPIVKNLMPKPTHSDVLWRDAAINADLYIVVYESYGTTPTLQASATSGTQKIFKACLSDRDWESYSSATWKNTLFFTNYPRDQRIEVLRNTDVYFNLLQDASKTLTIKLYGSNGGQIGSTYTATQNYYISQLNLNTSLLISTAGFTAPQMALASYYTVTIGTSETLTIYFKDDYCGEPNTLMWLNDFGAFESFVFEHYLEKGGTIEDSRYGKQFGKWSGTARVFDSTDSGDIRYITRQRNNGTAYTGWIYQDQQEWLCELYRSPLHRLYDVDGNHYGIRLTSNQFTFKNPRFEELISESVAFDYTYDQLSIGL